MDIHFAGKSSPTTTEIPQNIATSRRSSGSGASSAIIQSDDSSETDQAKVLQARSNEEKIADDLEQKISPQHDKGKGRDVSSSSDDEVITITPQSRDRTDVSSLAATTTTIVAPAPGPGPGPGAGPGPGLPPVPPQQGGTLIYRSCGGCTAFVGASCALIFISSGLMDSSTMLAGVGGGVSVAVAVAGVGLCLIPEMSRLRAYLGHAEPT